MLNADGVPLFAGVEDTDDLLITTLQELEKDVTDLVTVKHPLYWLYKQNNWIEFKDTIGAYVPVPLMDKANTTVKSFSGYDDADMTPQDALSEARFAYGHMAGTQMYNREQLIKNANNIKELSQVLQEQLVASLTNHFGDLIIGSQDADGKDIMGIGRVMAYDQSCGGITPTTPGYEYWNPKRGLKSGGGQYALATEMREGMTSLIMETTRNGETPKVWLMGQDVYLENELWWQGKLAISAADYKARFKNDGFEDFNLFTDTMGRTYIYEPGLPAKTAWLLNPKRTIIRIHTGTNFVFEPWQFVPGKIAAKSRQLLLYAAVYCKRRDANGYIEFT